jgi:hypothetical protein
VRAFFVLHLCRQEQLRGIVCETLAIRRTGVMLRHLAGCPTEDGHHAVATRCGWVAIEITTGASVGAMPGCVVVRRGAPSARRIGFVPAPLPERIPLVLPDD